MLHRIWYKIIKIYISIGLWLFYKRIIIKNIENVPRKGAVLLVSNHKNALIDPLLIATSLPRQTHFLTRASAFKIGFVKWLLSTVNMLPIYRMRDGKETLAKNEEIFNECYSILNDRKCLLIFPEGTHEIRRLITPLSKGFTRIVFGFLKQYPNVDLQIVPIGLNYTSATKFGESVSVYYGKPLLANTFYNIEDINESTINLKNTISEKLKELTVHIDIENYNEVVEKLGNVDYLDPYSVNELLSSFTNIREGKKDFKKPSFFWKVLKFIVAINSIIPLIIFKLIEPNIKEIEFVSTTKFAIGLTAVPLFYFLQTLVVYSFFGTSTAIFYFITSVLLVLILAKTK